MSHSTYHSRDLWLAIGLAALLVVIGAPAASAQTPKVDGPTSGPKPEQLAQPPSETAPVKPTTPETTGSSTSSSMEERAPEHARPEGPTPLPERPAEQHGAPKEIR